MIVGEYGTVEQHPLDTEMVHRAHTAGRVGTSVFRGIEGFGASSGVHSTRILTLAEDSPVSVAIVDAAERTQGSLPVLVEIVVDELMLMEDVRVVHTAGRPTG